MFETPTVPEVLRQADIFAQLTSQQLALIAAISTIREYNAGDTVFEENSACNELYIIADGEIDIRVDPSLAGEAPHAGPMTISTLRRGQSFGEMALVDMGLRSATASCAQHETHLVVIPRHELMELCESHPELGFVLMRNLAVDLAGKIRASGFQVREWLTWSRGAAD
jgi:CRP-like cAMP-binding protein